MLNVNKMHNNKLRPNSYINTLFGFFVKPYILPVLLCLITMLLSTHAHISYAQEKTLQLVLASEMPDIADPKKGRYAKLKALITSEREKVPTTFFIFGGGSIGPSALSNLDRGSHIIDILNSIEPDAMGVSKREFSFDVDELSMRSYEAAFPIIASNLIDTRLDYVPDGLVDRALISRNNINLGIISVSDERLIHEYLLSDIIVENKSAKIRTIAQELRSEGADLILLHYFDDFPEVFTLLDENVIDYGFISITRAEEEYRKIIQADGRVFMANDSGQAIVATISLEPGFPLSSVNIVDLSKLSSDPLIENQVNSYLFRLNRLLDDNIAYWEGNFTTRRDAVRNSENGFANFVVDAMRKVGKADIALLNGGSIRGDTNYENNMQISRRTIATELPFRSTLRVISVTGKQIKKSLELGLAGIDNLRGAFLHVSGINLEYDAKAEPGNRLLWVKVDGIPIDDNTQYSVATTQYLAAGGDGHASLSKGIQKTSNTFNNNVLISDLVLRELRMKGKLDGIIEHRIVAKGSKS